MRGQCLCRLSWGTASPVFRRSNRRFIVYILFFFSDTQKKTLFRQLAANLNTQGRPFSFASQPFDCFAGSLKILLMCMLLAYYRYSTLFPFCQLLFVFLLKFCRSLLFSSAFSPSFRFQVSPNELSESKNSISGYTTTAAFFSKKLNHTHIGHRALRSSPSGDKDCLPAFERGTFPTKEPSP